MTDHDLHILRHSLGLDDSGRGNQYRNYFAANPSDPDMARLGAAGLMELVKTPTIWGGLECWRVTVRGLAEVEDRKPQPVKLTRSQARYRKFLDMDTGMKFGEWLTHDWSIR